MPYSGDPTYWVRAQRNPTKLSRSSGVTRLVGRACERWIVAVPTPRAKNDCQWEHLVSIKHLIPILHPSAFPPISIIPKGSCLPSRFLQVPFPSHRSHYTPDDQGHSFFLAISTHSLSRHAFSSPAPWRFIPHGYFRHPVPSPHIPTLLPSAASCPPTCSTPPLVSSLHAVHRMLVIILLIDVTERAPLPVTSVS